MMTNLIFSILILLTVGLNTLAQVLLKSGATRELNLYLLGGISLYGLSTLVYLMVLSKFNLSLAYPVVIGLTVVATTIASTSLLQEKVSFTGWLGIGLMLSGISAIAYSNH